MIWFLVLKMIWNLLDIHSSGSVNWTGNWMWIDSPFVFYMWSICWWKKQWTVSDIPNFEELILVRVNDLSYKLICSSFGMFGSKINLLCLGSRFSTQMRGSKPFYCFFMLLFCSMCCMLPYGCIWLYDYA